MLPVVTLSILLSAPGAAKATSAAFDPNGGPEPVVVLLEAHSSGMVIGSDTPSLVVYENRLALQLRTNKAEQAFEYVAQTLDERTYGALLARLGSLTSGTRWKPSYDAAPGVTDQGGGTRVYLRMGDTAVVTRVRGFDFDTRGLGDAATNERFREAAAQVPAELRAVVKELRTLSLPAARKWEPPFIEMKLSPYRYVPDRSVAWPARWPGLQSERSIRRGNDSYSIYLSGTQKRELERFVSRRKPSDAVELGGRKWDFDSRFVFPAEPTWRKAFSSLRE
jgi:hypothetical protein